MKTNFKAKTSFGLLATIFALPVLMLYQNCSKVGVSDIPDGAGVSQSGNPGNPGSGCAAGDPTCNDNPSGNPTNPPPKTCTTTINDPTVNNVKVFFLIDISGSNQSGQGTVSATDPSAAPISTSCGTSVTATSAPAHCKPWRLGVLEKFLGLGGQPAAYMKAGFSFQLGYFQGSSASALITSGGKTIFADGAAMQSQITSAVNMFLQQRDNDNTPYQAVLNMAAAAIQQDMSLSSVKSKYVIIMLTDGMPTDAAFSTSSDATNKANLAAAVSQLVNVSPGYITFNAIQYYPADGTGAATALPYLQAMATAGSGKALSASSGMIPFQIDNSVNAPTGSTTTCPNGVMP